MSQQLSEKQIEKVEHIFKYLRTALQESKITLNEWGEHDIREMVLREIFFDEELGKQSINDSEILFATYFQRLLSEKEHNRYRRLENLFIDISTKRDRIHQEADEISKKISEMVSEREQMIESGNKNYEEASTHQPQQKELEEEDQRLEKEWESLSVEPTSEEEKTKLNKLIEDQRLHNEKKSEFINNFSKFLRKEEEIKREIESYSKQVDKYHANWAKLNKEWTDLSQKMGELQEMIFNFQNQKLVEILQTLNSP